MDILDFEKSGQKVAVFRPLKTLKVNIYKTKSFSFHTIQLYDLHPFPFNILTYEAEALLFKVTLELRINLHKDNIQSWTPTQTVIKVV